MSDAFGDAWILGFGGRSESKEEEWKGGEPSREIGESEGLPRSLAWTKDDG